MNTNERNVLVVDDEPDIFWAMENLLKGKGFVLTRALNGLETSLLMQSRRFDLVLLDAKLPDIEGLALARKIKVWNSAAPIILISGYLSREDQIVRDSLANGLIFEYISKPFQHSELLSAIRALGFL